MHRGDCIVAVRLQLCNIDSTDAMCLNGVDVDNEAVLGETHQLTAFLSKRMALTSLIESSLATDDGIVAVLIADAK